MKRRLLTGVVLTTGLLVSGLKADVAATEGIKTIYRRSAERTIKTNNNNIEDVLGWAEGDKEKCIKQFLALSAQNNEELKGTLKVDPKTDDVSTLKSVSEVAADIKERDDRIMKSFLLCMQKINEKKTEFVIRCRKDSEAAVKDLEKRFGEKSDTSDKKVVVPEQSKQQKVSAGQGTQNA